MHVLDAVTLVDHEVAPLCAPEVTTVVHRDLVRCHEHGSEIQKKFHEQLNQGQNSFT